MTHIKTHYQTIVIGSGAAGAVMAYERARLGDSVLVLEKGNYNKPADFEHDELEMYANLYKLAGLQTTKDNDTTIAQGFGVGGSTVINNAIWMRPELDALLNKWSNKGCHIPKAKLESAYDYLEAQLKVQRIQEQTANSGSEDFLRGCKNLNIPADYLDHNRTTCLGCGWCNYGCKYNRKTSMLVTFIPWAESLGALVIGGVDNATIQKVNDVAKAVTFKHLDVVHTVKADRIIVCAGAIGSSEVLLRSGITVNGNVGKNFHMLGGFFMSGLMDKEVNGYEGIGLSCIANASDEYLIETFFAPPGVFSVSMNGWFETHHQRMLDYNKYLLAGVMVGSEPTGTISLNKKQELEIDFKFSEQDLHRLKKGLKKLAQIFFAAGSTKVYPASFKDICIEAQDDLEHIDTLIQSNDDLILGSAHPQGGNIINDDPQLGVVNSEFKVHGLENLFVVDASVFPTNLWANCQATVMAMSQYASSII